MLRNVQEEVERLATLLRSLPDATLRVAFLRDYLADGESLEVARTLDDLCDAAARARYWAREPVLALAMLLAGLAEDPVLDRLGRLAVELDLGSLSRLLRRAPQIAKAKSSIHSPNYGFGRELSIGERRSLARRPTRALFDKLLRDPHPLVIEQLLINPRLTEDDLVRLSALRPAHVEAQRAIARTAWLCRPRVRLALIQNPGTPSAIAIPLLAACTRSELRDLRGSGECSPTVRETAEELLFLRSLLLTS